MAVSSHPQKLEAKINSGDIFVGLVWLVLNAAMILTCLCPLKLSHYRCASGRVWHGSEAVFGRGVFEDIAAG
jgi:hypothetical protein